MKKILIATTGISARAIYRQLKENKDYEIIGFLEKNEELEGNLFDNKKIFSYNSLKNIDFDKIVIGGVHIDEIKNDLIDYQINEKYIWSYPESKISYFSQQRSKDIKHTLKILISVFDKLNINYILFGSSLLSVFRNKDLSTVSDIDFIVLESKLELIYKHLINIEELKEYNIHKVICEDDYILNKKGEIQAIAIQSKRNKEDDEPIIIEIERSDVYKGKTYIAYMEGDYFCYEEELLQKTRFIDYDNLKIKIPYNAEFLLEKTYGKNWIEIPKKWSKKDYGNLVNKKDI